MSTNPRSTSETLGALSSDKARLLRLMLQRRSASEHNILPRARMAQAESVRLPASSAQQRLWFIDQLEEGFPAYHVALALRLQGTLDEAALRTTLQAIVQRHEALRTIFVQVDGAPHQQILAQGTFPLNVIDLRDVAVSARPMEIQRHKNEEFAERFDLSRGPLVRGRLLRLADRDQLLLITMHHIVSDGWSMGVFLNEFRQLYSAIRQGRAAALAPLPIQYGDYSEWHREWLQGAVLDKQLSYWKEQLSDCPPQIELPADRPRPAVQSYRGGNERFVLDPILSQKLRGLARSQETTLFMVLLGAWSLLLSRLSGQEDLVVGTPVANRPHTQVEELIGFFVNTLALRVKPVAELSVRAFYEHIKQVTLGAFSNQDVPFEKVVEAVQPERSLSRNPLFQTMFALQNAPKAELRLPDLTASTERAGDEPSLFDVLLVMQESGDELSGDVSFALDLFDHETVNRWLDCFKVLLAALTDDPDARIGSLPILTSDERRRVVAEFNATEAPFPQDKAAHELFELQVERSPNALIIEHDGIRVSYAELNARANQLARHLVDQGITTGAYVPVIMPRSLQMLIAELAVLKCGAAYVPMDPALPPDRLAFMVRDCGAIKALTAGTAPAGLTDLAVDWIDSADWEGLGRYSQDNLAVPSSGTSACYVTYTSGSTGTPKGVIVPHRGINRLIINAQYARIDSTDCVAHISNPAFDASTFEIWAALLNGARLVIVPPAVVLDAASFAKALQAHRITVLFLTVGLLNQYVDALAGVFGQLRYLITGGDIVDPSVLRRVLNDCPPEHLLNAYGPTECTTYATTYRVEDVSEDAQSIPIGRPIGNTRVYILDKHRQPVPIGVTGELYLGGPGVALGYLNRAQLTEERFIADTFASAPGARLYRTGDLGRWRADGNIEFRGRNDQQVKIRGYRIELGEIESRLAAHPAVAESVVLAREDVPGQKRLVAYFTTREEVVPGADELRGFLRNTLPEYMLPSAFVALGRLPLNASGKVDRRALQAPQIEAYASQPHEPPRGEVERALADIWRDLLRVDRVGRHDNFFELGGHSLLMVQMMERLRRAGLDAKVRSIYESTSLADLARTLVAQGPETGHIPANLIVAGCTSITPEMLPLVCLDSSQIGTIVSCVPGGTANVQDIYPLAPLQEGILFHHLLDPSGVDPYVLPTLIETPSRQKLDELISALQAVIDRHDILRTAVLWENLPQPVQVVYRKATLPVTEVFLDPAIDPVAQMTARMNLEHRRLTLSTAPLMWLEVAAAPHGTQWYALLYMHHVVCDHESHDQMFSEVIAHIEGREHALPQPMPYRNHVAQTVSHARTHDAEAYFRSKLADVDEPTVPFGLSDAHAGGLRIEQAHDQLASELAQQVRALSRKLAVSPATLFHSAWALVLSHTSNRDDVVFGSVLLGRMQGSAGAQRTLGMFINTLPLRIKLRDIGAKELVQQTQRELKELLSHEQASLATAQRCTGLSGTSSPFTTLLNYRHSGADIKGELAAVGVTVLAHTSWTNYPIMVAIDDLGAGFALSAKTDQCIDPRRLLRYLATAIRSVVDAVESAPETPALTLRILPEEECHEVIRAFNATHATYSRERLIHHLFEARAERSPDAIAVEHNSCKLSYADLNHRANQLARYLRTRNVGVNTLVGICVERSPDMLVGLLGILKAGAAYVPLDPTYPGERLQYMLDDAAPRIVLTQRSTAATLPATSSELITLDEIQGQISRYAGDNLSCGEVGGSPDSLVYVIYTSGSTGQPKGTEMPHGAMVNLVTWHQQTLPCSTGEKVLQFAALSFDVAFQEMFSTLSFGGTVVLLDESVRRDPVMLLDLLGTRQINRLFVPPLMLQSLAESFNPEQATTLCPLRDIVTAGEQLRISAEIVRLFKHLPECRLHNHYGPTETHVVTSLTLSDGPEHWPKLPSIGRPIANTQIYILNEQRQPVPVGVSGEIYIGGANVARGYKGRSALTTHRFVPDPYAGPGARMYKTGDLGRWHADGTIEYLGRNDAQVKIRGYRIELGEIEAQLARHPLIKQSVVTAREAPHGGKCLVAYLTTHDGTAVAIDQLRDHVKSALPEQMVPSAFVFLNELPVTSSGKLDRRRLPDPDMNAYAVQAYEPPQGRIEESLAAIWRELLRVERVGRHDHFFELGGHSLLAMKLAGRIAERLRSRIAVPAVFRFPSLQAMAQLIESLQVTDTAPAAGAELEEGFV